MRVYAALLLLLCVCTGAGATEKTEPFGVPFYTRSDNWAFDLQMRFQGKDKKNIFDIAAQVRQMPEENWLTWVNQLVNLSVEIHGPSQKGVCARQAVAKFEVLRQLGFPKESLRLVYGEGASGEHAVAAVRVQNDWLILDNGSVMAGYKPLPDNQVKHFHAIRSFY